MQIVVAYHGKLTGALPVYSPNQVSRRPRLVQRVYCLKRPEDRFPFDKPIHDEIFTK